MIHSNGTQGEYQLTGGTTVVGGRWNVKKVEAVIDHSTLRPVADHGGAKGGGVVPSSALMP